MPLGDQPIDHLLRRAGFGATTAELAQYRGMSLSGVISHLVEFEKQPDDTDTRIGGDSYVGVVTTRNGQFSPNTNIEDARQRWLFRMVHTQRPLQERMALFWHQHFATAYGKVAGFGSGIQGTKMMALVPGQLPGPPGQIELFRARALGKFRDLLIQIARDPAMLVWLDGRTNTRQRPQENFGREVMELFTIGLGPFTEADVTAAARVFTGWNLQLVGANEQDPAAYYEFIYRPNQHDVNPKSFTFPIYSDGGATIPARAAADGMQDGLDLLSALAAHPETARRLARKLWAFFVSEQESAPADFVEAAAEVYLRSDTEMRPVVDFILRSPWFFDSRSLYARYSWPVEFVVRAIKETGWNGFSIDRARTPLANMGQTLFDPPDVNGWELGAGWISTGAMLARMNFASLLAGDQRFNLARAVPAAARATPELFVGAVLERYSPVSYTEGARAALVGYAASGAPWTGADAQANVKAPAVARLIMGSAEYQFI